MPDIISVLMNHNILKVYREAESEDGILIHNKRIFKIAAENKKCRLFDITSDEIKEYKEKGEYKEGMVELMSKYDLKIGDIVSVQDEVRINHFYIRSVEFLSLEPLVSLFKNYQYVCVPFSGIITLENNSEINLYPDYIGGDVTN